MLKNLKRADYAMMYIVCIWGLHFVIVKDALAEIAPLTFQAIRMALGGLIFVPIYLANWKTMQIPSRDLGYLFLLNLLGPVAYQYLFIFGLKYTTSTNTALLIATLPTWTAIFSIVMGRLQGKLLLYFWIVETLVGVALVLLGQEGASISLNMRDFWGSLMAMGAAICFALSSILRKPLIDRYGGLSVAIWSHWTAWFFLSIGALPDLLTMNAHTIPTGFYPHIAYSGIMAGVGGFVIWSYALRDLGPTRASLYQNFTPLVAALSAITFLGESLTAFILLGGALILVGVMQVRVNMSAKMSKNTFVRIFIPTR